MSTTYTELFNLDIKHTYYTDGLCPDFSIVPTSECSEILQGHRIIVKNRVDGIQLVIAVTGESENMLPFIDISGISKFSFYMQLNESAFSNYTQLTPINKDQIYCYDNAPEESMGGTELVITTIEKSEVELPFNDVAVFGVIDIYTSKISEDLSTPSQYTISFNALKIVWRYYFITNQNHGKTTSVDNQEITFSPVDLDTVDDPIGQELREEYPNNDIELFKSDDLISYREKGRQDIEYKVEDPADPGTTDILIEDLPNPSIYDYGIKILKVIVT